MNITVIILAFIALIIAAIINAKFKVNLGVLCMAFAFIVGGFGLQLAPAAIIASFPLSMFFQLMAVTLLFGYGVKNGAMAVLTENVVYRTRNVPALIPFAYYLVGFLCCFPGTAPPGVGAMLVASAMTVQKKTGMNRYMALALPTFGATAGGFFPTGMFYAIIKGLLINTAKLDPAVAAPLVNAISVGMITFTIVVSVVFWVIGKGYSVPKVEMDTPPKFSPVQRKTIILYVVYILISVIPVALVKVIPALGFWTNATNPVSLAVVFAAIASLMKLGKDSEVIVTCIPWNIILMICGAAMLVSLMGAAGLTQLVIGAFQTLSLPNFVIPLAIGITAGILSFFVDSTGVVMPAFLPIAFSIHLGTGHALAPLLCAVIIGAFAGGLCPISTGGSMLMLYMEGEERDAFFWTVWRNALIGVACAVVTILAMTIIF